MVLKFSPLEGGKIKKLNELKEKDFFLVSDTHFLHEKIEQYEPSRRRYFLEGYTSMEDWLVDNWNKVVEKEDLVLHLGDFSFKESDIELLELIIDSLNGKKYLILGNHDKRDFKFYKEHFYFAVERGCVYAELDGKFWKITTGFEKATGLILETHIGRVLFSHYPIVAEEKHFLPHIKVLNEIFHKTGCVLNVHGHIHSTDVNDPRCINVSVEKTDFKPVRFSKILRTPKRSLSLLISLRKLSL